MRVLKALCCAATLTIALAPAAHADEWNKKTILTFSGAVQVPGATLPAGSYVFKLADIPGNRHVVQVFDKDETKIYTTILAIPNDRLDPTDKPVVLFSERASGSPQAVKVWYYPGDRIGDEFVYPKSQAMRIAKETHQRVLAYNDESGTVAGTAGEVPGSMKNAQVGYFDENGNWNTDANNTVAVNGSRANTTADNAAQSTTASGNARANAAQPNTAQSTTAQSNTAQSGTAQSTTAQSNSPRSTTARSNTARSNTAASSTTAQNNAGSSKTSGATGTSGSQSRRRSLPKTAGSMALVELLSGIAFAAALGVRAARVRFATTK